ncbi:hypothetical protein FDP41_012264 [Naegleria fowleri]|uniref:Uncharacterized protein n=1 Tax=Naegleria fowleri TaxID=5763 RepID=A0A6A5BWH2_NAEFO|nr:uncharacterized protein FDP41_012264 [Naegleria fowleri]KAF0981607.1 hypothetical protein FDP41_012264 [Naegleria fowleri]
MSSEDDPDDLSYWLDLDSSSSNCSSLYLDEGSKIPQKEDVYQQGIDEFIHLLSNHEMDYEPSTSLVVNVCHCPDQSSMTNLGLDYQELYHALGRLLSFEPLSSSTWTSFEEANNLSSSSSFIPHHQEDETKNNNNTLFTTLCERERTSVLHNSPLTHQTASQSLLTHTSSSLVSAYQDHMSPVRTEIIEIHGVNSEEEEQLETMHNQGIFVEFGAKQSKYMLSIQSPKRNMNTKISIKLESKDHSRSNIALKYIVNDEHVGTLESGELQFLPSESQRDFQQEK